MGLAHAIGQLSPKHGVRERGPTEYLLAVFLLLLLWLRPAILGALFLERLVHGLLPVHVDLDAVWFWAGLNVTRLLGHLMQTGL